MIVETYVVDESVLVYRADELEEIMGWSEPEFDPSTDVQVSPDDPRLNEIVIDNPQGDFYALIQTISIH